MVYEEKLVAYVMSAEASANVVSEESLKVFLEIDVCQLTSYMIPWRIIVMDEFQLTVNGKIDRTASSAMSKDVLDSSGVNVE